MVILELACLVVQGSKTAFEIQVRYRFPAEGLFRYVKFVHGHDDNHIGTAGFSYGLKAGFGEQVVLLLQGDFPYHIAVYHVVGRILEQFGQFVAEYNGFHALVVFYIFTDHQGYHGQFQGLNLGGGIFCCLAFVRRLCGIFRSGFSRSKGKCCRIRFAYR